MARANTAKVGSTVARITGSLAGTAAGRIRGGARARYVGTYCKAQLTALCASYLTQFGFNGAETTDVFSEVLV